MDLKKFTKAVSLSGYLSKCSEYSLNLTNPSLGENTAEEGLFKTHFVLSPSCKRGSYSDDVWLLMVYSRFFLMGSVRKAEINPAM